MARGFEYGCFQALDSRAMFPSEKLPSDLSYSLTSTGAESVKPGKTACSFLHCQRDDSVIALVSSWLCPTPKPSPIPFRYPKPWL